MLEVILVGFGLKIKEPYSPYSNPVILAKISERAMKKYAGA